jgi:hypothetical protein
VLESAVTVSRAFTTRQNLSFPITINPDFHPTAARLARVCNTNGSLFLKSCLCINL